jgi:hypothetical protein
MIRRYNNILLLFLVCACLLTLTSCAYFETRETRGRVTEMMEAWQADPTGSSGHMQHAVCMWYRGTSFMDDVELTIARKKFDGWRRQKGLSKIENWEIESITKDTESIQEMMLVSVKINGKSYRMRMAQRDPIEWAG